MHIKKSLLVVFSVIMLCGCSVPKSEMTKFTMPEKELTHPVDVATKSIVEQMAAQKHIKPELSDEFIKEHFNMESLSELKERTKKGISITQNVFSMTKKEFQLWKAIVDEKDFSVYTVDSMEDKKEELVGILNKLAEEKQKEMEEMLEQDFGMTEKETDDFIEEQAKKYVEKK